MYLIKKKPLSFQSFKRLPLLPSSRRPIRALSTPPDPGADDTPAPDPALRDPVIDPGIIHYQRASFEQLFHNLTVPLTGYELRRIVEGRRLKLSVENASVLLLVYHHTWTDATDDTWNSMAELLTDWSAEKIVRETLPVILSSMDTITNNPIKLPLRVRHEPPSPS